MAVFHRDRARRESTGVDLYRSWEGAAVLVDPGQLDNQLDYPPHTTEEEAMLAEFARRSHLARVAYDLARVDGLIA